MNLLLRERWSKSHDVEWHKSCEVIDKKPSRSSTANSTPEDDKATFKLRYSISTRTGFREEGLVFQDGRQQHFIAYSFEMLPGLGV